jgi:hypothetical protein
MATFKYTTGELIQPNDVVQVIDRLAHVEQVIEKGTLESAHFNCQETGGILLRFKDGDLQLWPWVNEDLVFLERQSDT